MKRKRDHSMLYAALAGFVVFAVSAGWLIVHTDWNRPTGPVYDSIPDGYQIIEDHDSHTFRDGVRAFIVKIPAESSESFAASLRKQGFTITPLPNDIHQKLKGDPETDIAADIANGLWWFENESPENCKREYTNYSFHIYDIDTCIYYYMKYDS